MQTYHVFVICTAIWELLYEKVNQGWISTHIHVWISLHLSYSIQNIVALQDALKQQTQSRNADDDDNDFSVSDLNFCACSRNNQEAIYLIIQLLF